VAEIERLQREAAAREAARLAALKRQQELEAEVILADLLPHAVYPQDYKRREHYYLNVEMLNAQIQLQADQAARPPPLK